MTRPDPLPELVGPFLERPGAAAVVTDFDGTLAPIVLDPASSRPLAGARSALHGLAARYRRVAVVSGRPVSFLVAHLGLDGGSAIQAYGLYGLEWFEDGRVIDHPDVFAWRPKVEETAGAAAAQLPADVAVERKGLSVTLHVRRCPEHLPAVERWAGAQADVTGLVVHPGRMSLELRPPVAVDKGTVVEQVTGGVDAACFIGDDVGDLPAFDALDRAAADRGVHVLKVGVRSEEAPAELVERADLLVEGPPGVLELLRRLDPEQRSPGR